MLAGKVLDGVKLNSSSLPTPSTSTTNTHPMLPSAVRATRCLSQRESFAFSPSAKFTLRRAHAPTTNPRTFTTSRPQWQDRRTPHREEKRVPSRAAQNKIQWIDSRIRNLEREQRKVGQRLHNDPDNERLASQWDRLFVEIGCEQCYRDGQDLLWRITALSWNDRKAHARAKLQWLDLEREHMRKRWDLMGMVLLAPGSYVSLWQRIGAVAIYLRWFLPYIPYACYAFCFESMLQKELQR